MSRSRRRPVTLILGLVAGLALVVGVISIFELPEGSVWEVLLPLFALLLLVILAGFVTAALIAWLRRALRKRQ